jgi:aminoglycoside phosphotransferase (APT) family kinase protein
VAASLEPRIAAYVAAQMPHASDVAVDSLARISGGASRETYRFRLTWTEGGEHRERKMILRRDPPASLIDTERRIEFAAYRAFHGSAVPVPEMLWPSGSGPYWGRSPGRIRRPWASPR